jgi:hypothetical protein
MVHTPSMGTLDPPSAPRILEFLGPDFSAFRDRTGGRRGAVGKSAARCAIASPSPWCIVGHSAVVTGAGSDAVACLVVARVLTSSQAGERDAAAL